MGKVFGGLIAVILLGLYVYAVRTAIVIVNCVFTSGCTTVNVASFTEGMKLSLTLIGGLVSALVIAELAITKPGEAPMARILAPNSSARAQNVLKIVTFLYLLVWLATGLLGFIVGYIKHPGVLQPLSDLGQSWLGLAIAAAYSYFGIKPR
jgi:predicted metal-binding membrane protein